MSTTKKTAQGNGVFKCIGNLVALLLVLDRVGMVVSAETDAATRPPNVVLFIMDDVGMGDLGCFGNHTIQTPNIDGLARDGARLTQHMAMSLCTPSRAALMTGRLPVRYGFGTKKIVRVFLFSSARGGLPSNETTIAELLKGSGYATALIGKWHLGVSCAENESCSHPNSQGFDYFYGLPVTNFRDCGSESTVSAAWGKPRKVKAKMWTSLGVAIVVCVLLVWKKLVGIRGFVFFMAVAIAGNSFFLAYWMEIRSSCVLMENRSIVEQPLLLYDHLTERLHGRAIQFVEQNRNKPFLLVMSFVQAHTALFNNKEFRNHSAHGHYGDNVEEMDWSVGEVLKALKRLGLEDKTFVYLTSDNGGHVEEYTDAGERQGGWNGVYKGGKGNTWEGGIRVPTIVKFPGRIPAGSVVSQPTHLPDVFPTVARVTGAQLPDDRVYDGRDMMPLLAHTDRAEREEILHEFMFHYCGGFINAVRYTPREGNATYKLHYATNHLVSGVHGVMGCFDTFSCECMGSTIDHHDPPLVYDLSNDPSEVNPLDSNDPKVGIVIRKVREAVATHRESIPNDTDHQFRLSNSIPRPWDRQRCGHFPYYSCTDPYLDQLKKLKGEK